MSEVTSEECSCRLRQCAHWGVRSTASTGGSAWAWGLLRGVFRGLRAGPQYLCVQEGHVSVLQTRPEARRGLSCLRSSSEGALVTWGSSHWFLNKTVLCQLTCYELSYRGSSEKRSQWGREGVRGERAIPGGTGSHRRGVCAPGPHLQAGDPGQSVSVALELPPPAQGGQPFPGALGLMR